MVTNTAGPRKPQQGEQGRGLSGPHENAEGQGTASSSRRRQRPCALPPPPRPRAGRQSLAKPTGPQSLCCHCCPDSGCPPADHQRVLSPLAGRLHTRSCEALGKPPLTCGLAWGAACSAPAEPEAGPPALRPHPHHARWPALGGRAWGGSQLCLESQHQPAPGVLGSPAEDTAASAAQLAAPRWRRAILACPGALGDHGA